MYIIVMYITLLCNVINSVSGEVVTRKFTIQEKLPQNNAFDDIAILFKISAISIDFFV